MLKSLMYLLLPGLSMGLGPNGTPAGHVNTTTTNTFGSDAFRNSAEQSLVNDLQGNNLPFGGPGGVEATQALANEAVQPVLSQFTASGRGPGRSGLADAAIARAAAVPFAARFGQERQLQQNAARSGRDLQQEQVLSQPFFEDKLSQILGIGGLGLGLLNGLGGLGGITGGNAGGALGSLGKLLGFGNDDADAGGLPNVPGSGSLQNLLGGPATVIGNPLGNGGPLGFGGLGSVDGVGTVQGPLFGLDGSGALPSGLSGNIGSLLGGIGAPSGVTAFTPGVLGSLGLGGAGGAASALPAIGGGLSATATGLGGAPLFPGLLGGGGGVTGASAGAGASGLGGGLAGISGGALGLGILGAGAAPIISAALGLGGVATAQDLAQQVAGAEKQVRSGGSRGTVDQGLLLNLFKATEVPKSELKKAGVSKELIKVIGDLKPGDAVERDGNVIIRNRAELQKKVDKALGIKRVSGTTKFQRESAGTVAGNTFLNARSGR